MAAKNRADAFADDMCSVLKGQLGIHWCKEPHSSGGYVDVIGTRNAKPVVLIEVELRRRSPLSNVVKVWRAVTQGTRYGKDVIMFQAFSAYYPKNGTARQSAEFLGKQMEQACGVRYFALSMAYKPSHRIAGFRVMVGAGRRRQHAETLAKTILAQLKKMKV